MYVYMKIAFFLLFADVAQGARPYNIKTELCCHGNVVDIPQLSNEQRTWRCCGADLIYKPLNDYDATITDEKADEQLGLTQKCCHGKLHKRVNATYGCCGTEPYDVTSEACLALGDDLRVLPISKKNLEVKRKNDCRDFNEPSGWFRVEEHLCCDFFDYAEKHRLECCGTNVMVKSNIVNEASMVKQLCCKDKIYEKASIYSECCGSGLMDYTVEACLEWGDDQFTVIFVSLENFERDRTAVCGKSNVTYRFYDPNWELCCSGVLHKKKHGIECCGDSVVDNVDSTCCVDYFLDEKTKRWKEIATVALYNEIDRQTSKCCKGVVMDYKKQQCCTVGPIDKPIDHPDVEFQCCGHALITDVETQQCVDDVIVSRENRNQFHCGGVVHDLSGTSKRSVLCINNTLFQVGGDMNACFLNGVWVPYNTSAQICGKYAIVNVNEDDRLHERREVCDEVDEPTYTTWSASINNGQLGG